MGTALIDKLINEWLRRHYYYLATRCVVAPRIVSTKFFRENTTSKSAFLDNSQGRFALYCDVA